ncbi:hypothetical protein CCACVL1_18560 [Corchorus capsularis]|uniref:Uncharacterized protein n=1 Tax=Corchorus capsularis TaxID=210143 RepID=A0A1R3HKU2_COCAP|nr:hypothetical protein CCACVL1_18560 [Corchorus capsularis]
MDIERYSDWGNQKSSSKRDSLDQILQLHSNNFPKELIGGLEKLDKFEKFEQQFENEHFDDDEDDYNQDDGGDDEAIY